jgi:hypothetical protein
LSGTISGGTFTLYAPDPRQVVMPVPFQRGSLAEFQQAGASLGC